jgi:multimeric flavodoxin WrbA
MIDGNPHGLSGFGGKMAAIIDEQLRQHEVSLETFSLVDMNIRTCTGCYVCCQKGPCIFNDDYQTIFDAMLAADDSIWLAPNYTFTIPAEMKVFIDRGFSKMHLQVLKGKYTLPIITSGSWVVDQVGISMTEWGQMENEKKRSCWTGSRVW